MARPKKAQAVQPAATTTATLAAAPVQQALPPQQAAPQPILQQAAVPETLLINRAEYVRVRDSVHSRLATIQTLLRDFATDYLRQSNLLLGEPTSLDNIPSLQALANLDHAALGFAPAPEPPAPVEEKKERKKRVHDPNAPKRPLTPYFLYMQTARPIIATDLGEGAAKGAVQEEGQRRWGVMEGEEKKAWTNAYQFNLRLYNARVHSYKNGNPAAKEMNDDEALHYADEHNIPQPALSGATEEPADHHEQEAIQQVPTTTPVAAAAVSEEVSKAKTPKQTRKRKSAVADVEEGQSSAVKNMTPAGPSPDKKRSRKSKGAETQEEPKKSGRKKKAT